MDHLEELHPGYRQRLLRTFSRLSVTRPAKQCPTDAELAQALATPLDDDYAIVIMSPDFPGTATALVLGYVFAAARDDVVLTGIDSDELDRRLCLPPPRVSPKVAAWPRSGNPFAHEEPGPALMLVDWPVEFDRTRTGDVIDRADALIIAMTPDRDSADAAADLVDHLAARVRQDRLPQHVIVVIAHPEARRPDIDIHAARDFFHMHGVCRVAEIPYDPHLAADPLINPDRLAPRTLGVFGELACHLVGDFDTHAPQAQRITR
ncbi:hypothetical protein ACTWPB_12540 [Nocardia sp. IBHARD005]|uniref:hypothetical protein n=1 Tax=Nocardia sp. IBHARD005 TaxID=3457765 RepID=UPI004058F1F9